MHGKYLRKIQLPYLHFLLQFDHNSCEATAIVAESENASTATEPDAGQSETNAETERTETTEVITEDSTETPAPVEVSGSTENSTILPLSYEDFNVNGFGYSNYVDLYGAGNGYEDVERISIMTTNCTAYTEYPDQMSSDTETSRGIKLGNSREQVIAAYFLRNISYLVDRCKGLLSFHRSGDCKQHAMVVISLQLFSRIRQGLVHIFDIL